MPKRSHLREGLYLLALALAAGTLLLYPHVTSEAVTRGLSLCGTVLLPSLFPFFVCVELFGALSLSHIPAKALAHVMCPLFHLRGECAAALLLGLLGGYPSGAQAAARLYASGTITRREAESLLRFCNNAGPAFLLGVVGGTVYHSAVAGLLLWGVHILCALVVGVLLRPKHLPTASPADAAPEAETIPLSFPAAFVLSVRRAGTSALQVCMYVVVFCVISTFALCRIPADAPAWLRALLCGVLELSNGTALLPGTAETLPLAAFLLGFSGLGVWAQTQALVSAQGLSLRGYLSAKLLHGTLSALVAWPLSYLPAIRSACVPAFSAVQTTGLPFFLPLWGLSCTICLYFRKLTAGNSPRKRV